MITSMFGVIFYGYSNPENTVTYNDYKFKITAEGYETTIGDAIYSMPYLPQDVEDVNISPDIKNYFEETPVVVLTSDPDSSYKQDIAVASYNINSVLTSQDKYGRNAFTSEFNDLPVITCENATMGLLIVEISYTNQTSITGNNQCLDMTFDSSYNLQRISTKLMYMLLGIIE